MAKPTARARAWHNIVRVAYPEDRLPFRPVLGAFLAGVGVDAIAIGFGADGTVAERKGGGGCALDLPCF